MLYRDKVYGKIKIESPVILELIKSPSLQRLKGVGQSGGAPIYFKVLSLPFSKAPVSRFDHSLGVFILLKKYGASMEEQIAGLIHDVSHTVFSHSADYFLDGGSEKEHSLQDNIFEKFARKTDIPEILERFGFNVNYILDEENFRLKERSLPNLCADRIDYSLRDGIVTYKLLSQKDIKDLLENLKTVENRWVFTSLKWAKEFAEFFQKINEYYSGIATALMFKTTGDVVSYALSRGLVTKEDLFTTDKEVLRKIQKFREKDQKLELLLKRMEGKIPFERTRKDCDIHCFTKSRAVDPLFFDCNGQIKRLSEANPKWAETVKEELGSKEYFIKFKQ